jgi:adenylate cyclase
MLCSIYAALENEAGALRAAEMAIAGAERALAHDPTNGSALGTGVTGFGILKQRERANEWIERALLISPDNVFMRYNFACTLAFQFHEPGAALDLLESVFPEISASAYKAFTTDPDLDSLRELPRFKRLMKEAAERFADEPPTPAAASGPPRS